MSDKVNHEVRVYEDGKTFILFPVEVSPKGLKTFTIDLDEVELIETGTKDKNKMPVAYQKYKVIIKK